MNCPSLATLSLAAALTAICTPAAMGQDDPASPDEPDTLRELIDEALAWYHVYPNSDSVEPAETRPVLRWANNARGSEDGVTLLYIHRGRPLATACVYPWAERLEHGFGSLSRGKIVARRNGQVVWQPQEPGVEFADVPDASAPEANRLLRLRQMKKIAEQFQATLLGWKLDNSDREELRLLSRPLYRYEPEDESSVLDGAVFAFAMGTDPEALLLLEAVKEGGGAAWKYAFVRRTSGELEGRFQDAVVWKAERFPQQKDSRLPYFTRGEPLPPSLVESQ